jgi:hypothetical protein
MQTVLSIDISSNPGEAIVANVEGKNVEILERYSLEMPELAESIFNAPTAEPAEGESDSNDQVNGADNSESTEPPLNPIAELLSRVQAKWTNAILTISTSDYLALNIDLPFGDNKNINRILDLEVQDLVPFEIDDFHLTHKTIAPITNGDDSSTKFDIHVGLISKQYIKKIMDLCHKANFEPAIVTTPSAVAGSVFTLAPMYFSEHSLVILERLPYYYLISCFDGALRNERILMHPSFYPQQNGAGVGANLNEGNRLIMQDLKLFMAGCEKRYKKNCEKIYFFGKSLSQKDLQNTLARSVEVLSLNEFIQVDDDSSQVATIAAVYAEENNISHILNNFRARAYAYNQKIKYLLQSLKQILPITLLFIACIAAFVAAKYFINQYKIDRLNSAINEQIVKMLPDVNVQPGNELKTLQNENQNLEDQLKDISSLSSLTPLDILLEISKDIPNAVKVTIKAVKIKDNKIVIDGHAQAYADVDNLHKILEKKTIYQRVKKIETSANVNGLRPFSFEIWVKE